jgi:hypothetical protein
VKARELIEPLTALIRDEDADVFVAASRNLGSDITGVTLLLPEREIRIGTDL